MNSTGIDGGSRGAMVTLTAPDYAWRASWWYRLSSGNKPFRVLTATMGSHGRIRVLDERAYGEVALGQLVAMRAHTCSKVTWEAPYLGKNPHTAFIGQRTTLFVAAPVSAQCGELDPASVKAATWRAHVLKLAIKTRRPKAKEAAVQILGARITNLAALEAAMRAETRIASVVDDVFDACGVALWRYQQEGVQHG